MRGGARAPLTPLYPPLVYIYIYNNGRDHDHLSDLDRVRDFIRKRGSGSGSAKNRVTNGGSG